MVKKGALFVKYFSLLTLLTSLPQYAIFEVATKVATKGGILT